MTRLVVLGPSGRMGKAVLSLAREEPQMQVVATVDQGEDIAPALAGADVYIDFTTPAATTSAANAAKESNTAAVIGTTGLDEHANQAILSLSQKTPVLLAPNFSIGVNLMLALVEQAAKSLGQEYDLEVAEIHHRRKRDAPSGTALAVAEALARGRGVDFHTSKRLAREGEVGERSNDEIGVVALRGGDVVGEHTAYFIGLRDRIEITHRANSRDVFAAGSLRAAQWIVTQPPGLYSMRDVLGI